MENFRFQNQQIEDIQCEDKILTELAIKIIMNI